MKQKKMPLNTQIHNDKHKGQDTTHEPGSPTWDNPIQADAFAMEDNVKIKKIAEHFSAIMHILGLDINDDSLRDTPYRVAKMYVKEAFRGLNPNNKPALQFFENKYDYDQMLVEKNITLHSYCEHHFVPIHGEAHVAYFPRTKIIGLSKINRLVQYYAKRPQVQERLTVQIGKAMSNALDTEDVAVVINANHMCVTSRGVSDLASKTETSYFAGKFSSPEKKQDFFNAIRSK